MATRRRRRARSSYPPYPRGKVKIQRVMEEFREGKLRSSSGRRVTSRKQAIAIALSEQRRREGIRSRDYVATSGRAGRDLRVVSEMLRAARMPQPTRLAEHLLAEGMTPAEVAFRLEAGERPSSRPPPPKRRDPAPSSRRRAVGRRMYDWEEESSKFHRLVWAVRKAHRSAFFDSETEAQRYAEEARRLGGAKVTVEPVFLSMSQARDFVCRGRKKDAGRSFRLWNKKKKRSKKAASKRRR